jgi:hypothetical protein
MALQSRLFPFWYPLTPDAVGLLESSPFWKAIILIYGSYFILLSITLRYIIMSIIYIWWWLCKAGFFLLDMPWPKMPLDCWNLLLYWKAIILITWFAIIWKLLSLLIRLYYSYLVLDNGSAKPAFSFLIRLDPDAVGLFCYYFHNMVCNNMKVIIIVD